MDDEIDFSKTMAALERLQSMFTCDFCNEFSTELFTIKRCVDNFCRKCADTFVSYTSCPICRESTKADDVHSYAQYNAISKRAKNLLNELKRRKNVASLNKNAVHFESEKMFRLKTYGKYSKDVVADNSSKIQIFEKTIEPSTSSPVQSVFTDQHEYSLNEDAILIDVCSQDTQSTVSLGDNAFSSTLMKPLAQKTLFDDVIVEKSRDNGRNDKRKKPISFSIRESKKPKLDVSVLSTKVRKSSPTRSFKENKVKQDDRQKISECTMFEEKLQLVEEQQKSMSKDAAKPNDIGSSKSCDKSSVKVVNTTNVGDSKGDKTKAEVSNIDGSKRDKAKVVSLNGAHAKRADKAETERHRPQSMGDGGESSKHYKRGENKWVKKLDVSIQSARSTSVEKRGRKRNESFSSTSWNRPAKFLDISNSSMKGEEKRDRKGNTPLQRACMQRREDVNLVKSLLVDERINPNVKDNNNWTPLHEAAANGFASSVKLLLEHGAIVDVPGGDDMITPLHDAVSRQRANIVEVLLDHGANPSRRNLSGKSPLDIAEKLKSSTIIDLLKTARKHPVKPASPKLPPSLDCFETKRVCLGYSGLRDDDQLDVHRLAEKFNCSVSTESVDRLVTHLVVPSTLCGRTLKFFTAIALGRWIVTVDWVRTSLNGEDGEMVSEEDYEASGSKNKTKSGAPRAARLNKLMMQPPLFKGAWIFCRNFRNQEFENDFKKVMEFAGAKIAKRDPKRDSDLLEEHTNILYHADLRSKIGCCNFLIVFDDTVTDGKKGAVNTSRIRTVPLHWVLDCLELHKIVDV